MKMLSGTDRKLFVPLVCCRKGREEMHRFFVSEENHMDDTIYITGDDVNHIRNVLRMTPGEKVVISCGKGIDYECEIKEFMEDAIMLAISGETPAVTELPVSITLFQALPKQDKMELVIQKAVELGVQEIVPVRTRRCVVKLDEKKEKKKIMRWQSIAEAAAKQSGRGMIPKVHSVMDFDRALQMAETMDNLLIPYELCESMKESVQHMKQAAEGKSIGVFIGPEGGFERGEIETAVARGATPISLGKRILRTETAGMTTLSVLMFLIEGKEGEEE